MTRTVKVVGGVIAVVALVILLAHTYLQDGSSPVAAPGSTMGTSAPSAPSAQSAQPAPSGTSAGRATSTARTPSPTRSACTPPRTGADGLVWVCLTDLPKQAQQTVVLIDRGGPFPYAKDGVTFNNFERVLPRQARGYYREYTVKTPGERDRGARRIVTGDDDRELFYTDDHYETFRRVQR